MASLLERLRPGASLPWDLALVTDGLDDAGVEAVTAAHVLKPERVLVAVDHDTPAGTVAVAEKQRKLMAFAKAQATTWSWRAARSTAPWRCAADGTPPYWAPGAFWVCPCRRRN